jgi:CHAT domain-containing protein
MMRTRGSRFVVGRIVARCVFTASLIAALPAPGLEVACGAPSSADFSPVTQAASTPDQPAITALEPGKPIERTLDGTEIQRYQLTLQKGQCAVIHVEQRGINVAVQLLGGGNEPLVEVDDEYGRRGTEKLSIIADHDGVYTVAVKPQVKIGNGAYEIRISEVRPATDQDRNLYEVEQLRTKVNRLRSLDKSREALPLAQQALTLAQREFGSDDPYVGLVTSELADVTYTSGKAADAKPQFERALQVLSSKLGPEHPQTIYLKSRLGSVDALLGELSKADELFNQALEAGEKTLGGNDPIVAVTLKSMAILDWGRQDFGKAEAEDTRALAILEAAGLTEQTAYGELLNNLGVLSREQGKVDQAAKYYARALAIQEKKFGTDSPRISVLLNNLGSVARQRKDYPAAKKYLLRSLAIKEKQLGPEHPEYAAVLMNLANVYASEGDYRKALDTHLRALKIFEKDLEPGEYAPVISLANVARNYAALGDFENANKFQSQMESAVESDIVLNLAIGSERQKLTYLSSSFLTARTDRTVSLNLQLEPDHPQAAATAAAVLLQRKGRVLDAMTDTLGLLRKHSSAEDQTLLDQLKETSTQLARLVLRGGPGLSPEAYRQSLRQLQEKKEKLENTISHHSEEFRAQSQAVTLEAVQAAVPAETGLVEFITYRPFNPKAETDIDEFSRLRYAAYVLHHDRAPQGIDLGEAESIDVLVEKLRAALREPSREDVRTLAQALAQRVFQPLQPLVSSDKRVLISPDGQLNLIPFEALLDDQGRYLVERFSITYLSTGRDLLRMQLPRPSQSAPVLVADPSFGEPALVATTAMPKTRPGSARTARRSVTTGTDFSSLYFAPLEGTKAEARSIHALFPDAQVLTGEQASESALEQLNAPRILHIATHGFFLEDKSPKPAGATVSPENPLLRSGLALSGANLVKDGKGDGILTALEASNLNLWGTKLVTLSACDTGVGEVKDREGVYGLRRSFFLAGAETLVMSLWPVSDYVTREMMTSYYGGLKHGLGRGEALRQAQLAMLKRKGREHPFYWASFIQSGEWANLDGQR